MQALGRVQQYQQSGQVPYAEKGNCLCYPDTSNQYSGVSNLALKSNHMQNLSANAESSLQYPNTFSQYPNISSRYPDVYAQYPTASSHYPDTSSQYPDTSFQYPELSLQHPDISNDYNPESLSRPHPDVAGQSFSPNRANAAFPDDTKQLQSSDASNAKDCGKAIEKLQAAIEVAAESLPGSKLLGLGGYDSSDAEDT